MRLQAARTVLRTIVNRVASDPAYYQQLYASPVDVLVKEGLPYDLIEDFLQETHLQAETTGYLLPGCANTCALTALGEYPEVLRSTPL
jgi:hypothetical protein